MDKLANMQAFVAVATGNSFAGAARKLQLAPSVVSKRVKDLEHYLGTKLIQRSTRQLQLTDTGRSYLTFSQKLLDDLNEVEANIQHQHGNAIGEIKLAAPISFAVNYLAPALAIFLRRYPKVSINTFLSDRTVNLVEEGYDLAIRIGPLPDSGLISKNIAQGRRLVVASPAYLQQHTIPQTPEQLQNHNCLSYSPLAGGKSWPFKVDGHLHKQAVAGHLQSDNGDLLAQAAIAGCGIALLPSFIVGEAIIQGQLVAVLTRYELDGLPINLVYPSRLHLSSKIRLLIDFFAEYFQQQLLSINQL